MIKETRIGKNNRKGYLCKCDCGTIKIFLKDNLIAGRTLSCGCLKKGRHKILNFELNDYKSLYNIWHAMKQRCHNATRKDYIDYGKYGISVCDEWRYNFQNFYSWAILNGYKKDLEIDRIDNNKNYEPNNCRWVTRIQNQRNKRDTIIIIINGEKKTIGELCEENNLLYGTIYQRLKRGWNGTELLSPLKQSKKRLDLHI